MVFKSKPNTKVVSIRRRRQHTLGLPPNSIGSSTGIWEVALMPNGTERRLGVWVEVNSTLLAV